MSAAWAAEPPLPSAWLAMLLADSRLPVGGHVYSGGLEPALRGGLAAAAVPAYLRARIATTVAVEAGTAVVARHLTRAAGDDTEALSRDLDRVECAWAARTPSRAVREVSRSLARGYLRLAGSIWPAWHGVSACEQLPGGVSRPVAIGVQPATSGQDADSLVRLIVYEEAQAIAAAMLKLEPLDPAVPVGWVLSACALAEPRVAALAALTTPEGIPATGAPQTEDWAEAHSRLTQRLFRA
jgi:urease accessory protein